MPNTPSTPNTPGSRRKPRITITIHHDHDGAIFAWIETRLAGGWWLNRRAALAKLRRHHPGAREVRITEQYHVPLKHRAFKVYFET